MIYEGDCVEVMAGLEECSVSAIVTDPPYDLLSTSRNGSRRINNPDTPAGRSARGFMGKTWDGTGVAFRIEAWVHALRVAKPGAHLLAFGGTRTYHRLVCAIEDAGWEIRDCLVWAYATGFPKSLDVSKAMDKAAGAKRKIVGSREVWGLGVERFGDKDTSVDGNSILAITAPATEAAQDWQGWGTALKPAWEPIVLARKPLRGTVAANVASYGTGALNIDGTRIPSEPVHTTRATALGVLNDDGWQPTPGVYDSPEGGRWPANVLLTDAIFDGNTPGVVGGGYQESTAVPGAWAPRGAFPIDNPTPTIYGDSGTYSRFFLIPKADRSDREPILPSGISGIGALRDGGRPSRPRENPHPTVKPVELMRHLIRLVTPSGGIVLDPFLGSGTTAIAAEMEGFPWIGIEKEPEYVAIARARLLGTQRGLGLVG